MSCVKCSYATERCRPSAFLAQDQCLGSYSVLHHDIESVSTSISDNLLKVNPEKRLIRDVICSAFLSLAAKSCKESASLSDTGIVLTRHVDFSLALDSLYLQLRQVVRQ